MNEIIFVVEEAPEGGYTASALGASIFTEADDLTDLEAQVRDAVLCHYDDEASAAPDHPSSLRERRSHGRMRPPRDISGEELARACATFCGDAPDHPVSL